MPKGVRDAKGHGPGELRTIFRAWAEKGEVEGFLCLCSCSSDYPVMYEERLSGIQWASRSQRQVSLSTIAKPIGQGMLVIRLQGS